MDLTCDIIAWIEVTEIGLCDISYVGLLNIVSIVKFGPVVSELAGGEKISPYGGLFPPRAQRGTG